MAGALAIPDRHLRNGEAPGLHPTRAAHVLVAGTAVGFVGEVDPSVLDSFGISERVAWLEIDLGLLLDLPHGDRPYRVVSKYPSSDVDLAFEVDDAIPAATVADAVRAAAGDLLVRFELFDVYRGTGVADGRRSLAYRLRFQAPDRTLTDGEVAEVRARCIEGATAVGATLRG